MDYKNKLQNPKWQRRRLEIMQRDNFTCQKCDDTETELHVHHIKYNGLNPWDAKDEDLETLCKDCHVEISYVETEGYFCKKLIKYKFLNNDVLFLIKVCHSLTNEEFVTMAFKDVRIRYIFSIKKWNNIIDKLK